MESGARSPCPRVCVAVGAVELRDSTALPVPRRWDHMGGAVGLCDLSGSAPPPARSRLRSGGGRGGGFPARPRSLRTPLAPGHGTRLNTLKCKVRCSVVAGSCHAGRGLLGRVAVARVVRGRWSTISIESQSNFDYVRSQNSISVLTSSHFGAQGGSSIEAIVKGV